MQSKETREVFLYEGGATFFFVRQLYLRAMSGCEYGVTVSFCKGLVVGRCLLLASNAVGCLVHFDGYAYFYNALKIDGQKK